MVVAGPDIVDTGLEFVLTDGEELEVWMATTGGIGLALSPPETNMFGLFFKGGLLAFVIETNGPSSTSG